MHSQCPTADQLALLLKDELSQAERTLLEAHVQECTFCREQLNVLSGGDAPRIETAIEPDTPEYKALLARLKPEASGDRLGPYKLLQELGEGGFGSVWMAEQTEPVKRRVALKIIKLGMDTKEVIARFEQERQALAMMDHPNIAKVFDAGATQWGRPFFVMELVRGMPMTEYCDEQKLSVPARLALFIQVCQAVQHAHQKGIIHRDLKPSNILISAGDDHEPVPKIIDFGVAKAMDRTLTDKTLFTQFEQMIGTPTYMSPEQAGVGSMDIDTRSDIYSLGVLLYELLTGKPPFDPDELRKAGHDEMRRVIREEEPPRPSTRLSTLKDVDLKAVATRRHAEAAKLASTVRGDLDWIVMKALEKNRNRRYETANGLAMDLRRHLGKEPVLARPPTFCYRIGKFAQKHKGPVAAAIALVMVLIGGLATSTALYLREKAAWKSEAAQRAAAQQHAQAEAAARQDAETVSTFLRDYFRSSFRSGGRAGTAAAFADAVKALELKLVTQPSRRARLQEVVGAVYYATERYRDAIPLQEKVKDYYIDTLGMEHRESLEAMNALAGLYAADGRRNEAQRLWDTVINLRQDALGRSRSTYGDESRETFAPLRDLARSYDAAGRGDDAIKTWETLVALSRKASGEQHDDTLAAMNELARAHEAAGRKEDAERAWEALLVLRRKLAPDHPETLRLMTDLASSYYITGQMEKALKMTEDILMHRRSTLGREHPSTIGSMERLSYYYSRSNRHTEAIKLEEEVLEVSRKVKGPEHPDTLRAMNELASSYSNVGREEEAYQLKKGLLALRQKLNGPEHPDTLRAMYDLLWSRSMQQYESVKLEEELLALYRKTKGLEQTKALSLMSSLSEHYSRAGRRDDSLQLREEMLILQRNLEGPKHSRTYSALKSLSQSYADAGLWDKALPLMVQMSEDTPIDSILALKISVLQAWFGKHDDHSNNCRRIFKLAQGTNGASTADRAAKGYCLLPSSDPDLLEAALTLARRAVELGKDHQYLPYYKMSLGMAEYRNGNYKAADELLLAAEKAEKAHRHVREAVPFFHAMSLFRRGKQSEARKRFNEAKAQMKPLPADDRHPLANKAESDDIVIWLAYKEAKALLAE